jgi:hypothetical protein
MLREEHGLLGPDYERQRKKLRKKGWSDKKIDRWIDDKQHDSRKAMERNLHCVNNPPRDVRHWLEFISEVLNAKAATHLGLLVHWYDGPIETERVRIIERRWTPLKKLDYNYLLRADHDMIHTFQLHDYRDSYGDGR